MKLYELSEAYAFLMNRLDQCQSDDEELAVLIELNDLSEDISEKGEVYARIIRNKQAEAEALDAEIKRLQRRKKSAENTVSRLKDYILFAMDIAGAAEIITPIGKWKIQNNAPSVVILDERAVPEEFTVPQPPKAMKTAIMQHFKETGEIPEGCEIIQGQSVRFR